MGLYGSRLAPTTAIAPRSSREKLRSADQPSRMASSALAAPALPGRYLQGFQSQGISHGLDFTCAQAFYL